VTDGLQTKEFIETLPGVTASFWDQIPDKDLPNTIKLIGDLSFRYFHSVKDFSINSLERDMVIPTSDFIPALKLISVLDKLSQRIAASDGTPRYNLYQKAFDEILFSQNPKVNIKDSGNIQQFRDLRAYWERRKPPGVEDDGFVSFFGMEVIPGYLGLTMFVKEEERYRGNDRIDEKNIYGKPVKKFNNWEFQRWARDYLAQNIDRQTALRDALLPMKVELEELAMISLGDTLKMTHNRQGEYRETLPKILPADFYTFRDVSVLVDYFLKGVLKPGMQYFHKGAYTHEMELFKNDRLNARIQLGNSISFLKCDEELFSFFDSVSFQSIISKLGACRTTRSGHDCYPSLAIGHLFANTPPPSEAIGDILSFAELRRRYSAADIYGKSLKELGIKEETIAVFGQERIRELLLLSSDPELQVSETLSYFSQHRDFFNDPQMRWLFDHLIFEAPLLIESLEKGPEAAKWLVENFASLLHREYVDFAADSDEAHVLFIIKINRVLEEIVNDVSRQHPDIFPSHYISPLPDVKKKIIQLLNESTSISFKGVISRELAISYGNSATLSEVDLPLFLTANVAAHFTSLEVNDPLTSVELQVAVIKQKANIERLLTPNDKRNDLINQVVGKFVHNLDPQTKWAYHDTFPLITNGESEYRNRIVFDIVKGKIWTSQGVLGSLPHEIVHNPTVGSLGINFAQVEVHSIGENLWSLYDQNGIHYRINSQGPIIQKLIGENWYQLDEAQNIAIKALQRDKQQWVFKNFNGDTFVHIEDALTHKPFVLAKLQKDAAEVVIYKLDPITGAPTNLILDNVSNNALQVSVVDHLKICPELGINGRISPVVGRRNKFYSEL